MGLRIWNNPLVLLNSMETPLLHVFFAIRLVCAFIEDVDEVYGRVVLACSSRSFGMVS